MSTTESDVRFIEMEVWLSEIIASFICTIIQSWLLKKELTRIRNGDANYTTPYLRLWVFLCIGCGILSTTSRVFRFFPGFCHFGYFATLDVASASQAIFMGFYQLSRLYYCFSIDNIYSDKGYPRCLFYIMFIIGALLSINFILYGIAAGHIPQKCGILKKSENGHYTYYRQGNLLLLPTDNDSVAYFAFLNLIYFIWDILTLCLYIFKIQHFKNAKNVQNNVHSNNYNASQHVQQQKVSKANSDAVYNRINNIMYRILVITLFYEIVVLINTINWSLSAPLQLGKIQIYLILGYAVPNSIQNVVFSFSVTLMVEHNTKRYIKFLNFIQRFKLNYIGCCCCYGLISKQMKGFADEHKERKNNASATTTNAVTDGDEDDIKEDSSETDQNADEHIELTKTYETHDISSHHGQLQSKPLDASLATITI